MSGTEVTRPETLAFISKLATLPDITTNSLKASAGIADLVLARPWADTAFLPEDEIRRATGLAIETVMKAVPELRLVQRVAPGRRWSASHPGKASEWVLNLTFQQSSVVWPTHALSPANPRWDRGALGPNAWRIALALIDQFGFERGQFTSREVRAWTGMDARSASRSLSRAVGSFVSRREGRSGYQFEPDVLRDSNDRVSRPISQRELQRTNERRHMMEQQGRVAEAALPHIRPPRDGEDMEAYRQACLVLEGLIDRVTAKDNERMRAGIRAALPFETGDSDLRHPLPGRNSGDYEVVTCRLS